MHFDPRYLDDIGRLIDNRWAHLEVILKTPRELQVSSGETRFSPDKAYPEKFGAEAPEQPQNTARVKKVGFSPSALARAAGAKQAGRNRTAANS